MVTLTYSRDTMPEDVNRAASLVRHFITEIMRRHCGALKNATIWTAERDIPNAPSKRYHHIVIMPILWGVDVEQEWTTFANGMANVRWMATWHEVLEVAQYARATMGRQEGAF